MKQIIKNLSILVLAAFALIVTWYPLSIFAQDEETPSSEETAIEDAILDYQTQFGEYQVAHSDFVLKRTQHLRFKTLQSQQEAQEATVKLLQERDDVIIYYLEALKIRLNEAIGVDETRLSSLNVRIDSEISWWKENKARIPSAGSLTDLVADNKTAQGRWFVAEPLFYEVLATNASGKITDFDERLTDTFSELRDKIDEIKSDDRDEYKLSDRKLSQLDRWVLEADNRLLRAKEKHIVAEGVIDTIIIAGQRQQRPLGVYNTAILRLNESTQFLKDSGTFMKEIIREIKTKE